MYDLFDLLNIVFSQIVMNISILIYFFVLVFFILQFHGHMSHVMNVRWNNNDNYLFSAGGLDCCTFQWLHTEADGNPIMREDEEMLPPSTMFGSEPAAEMMQITNADDGYVDNRQYEEEEAEDVEATEEEVIDEIQAIEPEEETAAVEENDPASGWGDSGESPDGGINESTRSRLDAAGL